MMKLKASFRMEIVALEYSRSTFMHKNEIAEVRLFNFRINYFFRAQPVTEIRLRWVRRSLAENLSNYRNQSRT